ncbi:MAG: hypothetical protein U0T82_03240 [Bacteroidales bacterium]
MKKYSFLVYHREYLTFLDEIRKIGVLDIEETSTDTNERIQENLRLKAQLIDISRTLAKKTHGRPENPSNRDLKEILNEYKNLVAEEEQVKQKSAALGKTIRDFEPWGEFSPEQIRKLRHFDIHVHLYTCPSSRMKKEWAEDYCIEIINELNSQVYFALVAREDGSLSIDADPVQLPASSLDSMRQTMQEYNDRLAEISTRIGEMAVEDLPVIQAFIRKIDAENHYESVLINTSREAGEKLMVLHGFIPVKEEPVLDKYLDQAGIVYFKSDPKPGDKVPVILRNNRFSKLFEPIAKIYMLPSYWELDLTPYFAPFYMLFFGFCFGDFGYSLLYITILLIALRYVKNPDFRPLIFLGMFLSLGGIIFGILGGTIFGASIGDMNIPFLKGFMEQKGIHFLTIQESMILSFILGGIQMLFGMALKARNIAKLEWMAGFRAGIGLDFVGRYHHW